MTIYYAVVFFILGSCLGSFYNVVGDRLPKNESIISPRSHCINCGHILSFFELIPIFSYIFLKGKCRKCYKKIGVIYPLFELFSGILFALSFLIFGLSLKLLIALTFISILLIVIISDYNYMIIPDEVLIIGNVFLIIELFITYGLKNTGISIINGLIAFFLMWFIKILGDFFFKKESMGGGDIKLMFTFGLILGILNSIASIFLASIIGLPISLIMLKNNSSHEVPFGPYLSLSAIIIFLTQFDYLKLFW